MSDEYMSVGKRCRGNFYLSRHKVIKTKSRGYRCKYCDKPLAILRNEEKAKKK